MDQIVKDVLEWILTESSAPSEIRKKALVGLTGEVGVVPTLIGGIEVSDETYEKCAESMRNGKKIQAIKDLRTMSGCGLKEAKDAIEEEFDHINRLEERGF